MLLHNFLVINPLKMNLFKTAVYFSSIWNDDKNRLLSWLRENLLNPDESILSVLPKEIKRYYAEQEPEEDDLKRTKSMSSGMIMSTFSLPFELLYQLS